MIDGAIVIANGHPRGLIRTLVWLVVLGAIVAALLAAVPGLAGVTRTLNRARAGWVAAAVTAEVASGVAFVLFFRHIFWRGPRRFAARLAWAEMAASSLLPVGGVGGLGLGAWILRTVGMPGQSIAIRSSIVFLLTSAVNVVALTVCGLGLASGVMSGPSDPVLTLVPALAGVLVICAVLAIPRLIARTAPAGGDAGSRLRSSVVSLATGISRSEVVLRRHNWRLLGAVGYWAFDVIALWLAFRAFGSSLPFAAIAMGYLIGMVANALPIPGGLGAVDASLVGMLTIYGASFSAAAAATLVYRAIALWIPTMVGTAAYLLLRLDLRRPMAVAQTDFAAFSRPSADSAPHPPEEVIDVSASIPAPAASTARAAAPADVRRPQALSSPGGSTAVTAVDP